MKIDRIATRILLFRVVPGMETVVAERIREVVDGKAACFALIGHYDLLVVAEDPPEHRGGSVLRGGRIRGITSAREVVAYEIFREGHAEGIAAALGSNEVAPLLQVTFFRLPDPLDAKQTDQPTVRSFLGQWSKTAGADASARILGTVGNPEFIAVQQHASLKSLAESTQGYQSSEWGDLDKTTTLIAFDPKLSKGKTEASLPFPKNTDLSVGFACVPRYQPALMDRARAMAERLKGPHGDAFSQSSTVGSEDFILRVPNLTCGFETFVAELHAFRAEMCGALYSSQTSLSFPMVEAPCHDGTVAFDAADPDADDWSLSIDQRVAKKIGDQGPCGREGLRTLYTFENLMQDRGVRRNVRDLYAFHYQLKKRLLALANDDPAATPWSVDRFTVLAQRGLQQRLFGTFISTHPQEPTAQHLLGGFHRIVQAAESVPLAVARQFRESDPKRTPWTGFVLVDNFRSFESEGGAIKLPRERGVWDQRYWVHLLHEALHCILYDNPNDFRELHHAGEEALAGLDFAHVEIEDAVEEVIVDTLEWSFGPWWNLDLCVREYWRYFGDLKKESRRESHSRRIHFNELRPFVAAMLCGGQRLEVASPQEARDRLLEFYGRLGARARSLPRRHREILDDAGQSLDYFERLAPLVQGALDRSPVVTKGEPESGDVNHALNRRRWYAESGMRAINELMAGKDPGTHERCLYPELLVWAFHERTSRTDCVPVDQAVRLLDRLLDTYIEEMRDLGFGHARAGGS